MQIRYVIKLASSSFLMFTKYHMTVYLQENLISEYNRKQNVTVKRLIGYFHASDENSFMLLSSPLFYNLLHYNKVFQKILYACLKQKLKMQILIMLNIF